MRTKRPEVPIIILSATLERKFGGIADMHLLKGSSSVDDLVQALRSFEAKRRGRPVVVDSRDFYYSRIIMAMGDDMVIEILDRDGNWQYVNDYFAALSNQRRAWYPGRNIFDHFPEMRDEWGEIIRTVADTRETYIDRRNHRAMPHLPAESQLLAVECAGLPHQTARWTRRRGPERPAHRKKSDEVRRQRLASYCSRVECQHESLLLCGSCLPGCRGAGRLRMQLRQAHDVHRHREPLRTSHGES